MAAWKRKEEWKKTDGRTYTVVVSRHEETPMDGWEGPHRWCVYAYIYPEHPHFKNFNGDYMWQEAATALPMHGGPSLLHCHYRADGSVTSYQVGADYYHLHDEMYTDMADEEDAYAVFADAENLIEWLENSKAKGA